MVIRAAMDGVVVWPCDLEELSPGEHAFKMHTGPGTKTRILHIEEKVEWKAMKVKGTSPEGNEFGLSSISSMYNKDFRSEGLTTVCM